MSNRTSIWQTPDGGGTPISAVESVFSRTGNVIAQAGDYRTTQINNDSSVSGVLLSDALDNLDGDIKARVNWVYPYIEDVYPIHTMTKVGAWTMIANKETGDRPEPQPVGDPFFLYQGVGGISNSVVGKQVVYGTRVSKNSAYWVEGYRINVIAGNNYQIITVKDPIGAKEAEFVNAFKANTSGWREFGLVPRPITAGTVFDIMVIESQPDPTPVITLANYIYNKPNNDTVPLQGYIQHSNKSTDELWIHYIDNDAVNRESLVAGLVAGGLITIGGKTWAVQDVVDFTTYAKVTIAPSEQVNVTGLQEVTFETPDDSTLTYLSELDYWLGNPDAKGLFVEDDSWENAVIDNNAYGADIVVQEAEVSDDWDLVAYSGEAGSASSSTQLFVETINSTNGEVNVDFVGDGDDQGIHIHGGQLSVGQPFQGWESIFGEGDSYPVPYAFHCKIANTTGQVITGAVDVSVILQTDEGSTTGLFGGTTTDEYILIGSPYLFGGIKAKIDTLGDVDADSIQAEYLDGEGGNWFPSPVMATKSNYPFYQYGNKISNVLSEHWRFGFNPLRVDGLTDWELSTMVVNGVSIEAYWGRYRIIAPIVSDPSLEQLKLHTSRTEINARGNIEYFDDARPAVTLQSGLKNIIPNALSNPPNESIPYGSNFTAVFLNNEFSNSAVDGFGLTQGIDVGLDTSIPLVFSISFYVKGTGTGNIEFNTEVFQVGDGFVHDGTAIPDTNSEIVTIATNSNLVRQTVQILLPIEKLRPADGSITISLYRDATNGNPNDTLPHSVVIENVSLVGHRWKA